MERLFFCLFNFKSLAFRGYGDYTVDKQEVPSMDAMKIGQRIATRRKVMGFTQKAIAERLHVSTAADTLVGAGLPVYLALGLGVIAWLAAALAPALSSVKSHDLQHIFPGGAVNLQ